MKKEINFFAVEPIPLLLKLLRNWYWFVIMASIGYGIANLYLRYQIPRYEIQASLKIKEGEEDNIGQKMIVDQMGFDDQVNLEDEIFYLKSSPLMERVVEDLGLDISYVSEGRVISSEIYGNSPISLVMGENNMEGNQQLRVAPMDSSKFVLIQGGQDSTLINYNEPFTIKGVDFLLSHNNDFTNTIKINIQSPKLIAERYSNRLQIYPLGRSQILNFSLTDEVPEKAKDILKKLMDYYALSIVEEKNESSEKSLKFIDERLAFITEELYQAEKNVENYQRKIEAPVGIYQMADNYSSKIAVADQAITDLSMQEDFLNSLSSFLSREANQYKLLTVPEEVAGDVVGSLADQYNELLLERQKLLLSADVENPYVKLMEEQITGIKRGIIQSVDRLKSDVANRIAIYEGELQPVKKNLRKIPRQQRELVNIMRQKNIKEELYLYLLKNREEAGLSIAAQTVNTRIINPPFVSAQVSPQPNIIYVGSVFLFLCIPLVLIVGRALLDTSVHDKKDIIQYTQTPFLGNIGLAENPEQLIVEKSSRSSITEMFHLLRTNLQFLLSNDADKKVVLLTSGKSGDGKTFVAANLVGMDLRKPRLTQYLSGYKSEAGVSNYLIGAAPNTDDLIQKVEGYEHLFFIGSGPIPPNPTDLLYNIRTKEFINLLRSKFDMVIIDTAPVGLVSDALVLGEHVGATIYVMRYKETRLAEISMVDELHEEKKLPKLSIVLNGVRKGSRYGYSYTYKYGYGYYQKEKKAWQKWLGRIKSRGVKSRVVNKKEKGMVEKKDLTFK